MMVLEPEPVGNAYRLVDRLELGGWTHMSTRAMTLEVADDGTLTIPVDLIRMLRLSPRQTITIEAREDAIVLVPLPQRRVHRNASKPVSMRSRQERLVRIGHLLRTALAGVEWAEIESGRRSRWF